MKLLLGSKSPRRQQLIRDMGLSFSLVNIDCEETYDGIEAEEVAEHLAIKKSMAYGLVGESEVLLTSDTTVVVDNQVLNKPVDRSDAIRMLERLSGRPHYVISGVCLRSRDNSVSFAVSTEVIFAELNRREIEHYIDTNQPFDKAGSYGIQEWIGMCKIESIKGCFYNVMGLPTNVLYDYIKTHYSDLLDI